MRQRALAAWLVASVLVTAPAAEAQPAAVSEALRLRVEQLHEARTTRIRGVQLLQADAVAHFFQQRAFQSAWSVPAASDQIRQVIQNIEADGLVPADYHPVEIDAAIEARKRAPSPQIDADLQLLLTDAVAALVDNVRYGKVRPISLDPTWNVDPRTGAPRLERILARVVAASDVGSAIQAYIPDHFIYAGLKKSLARLRELGAAGGWRVIPRGAALKPGVANARIPAVRQRLRVTGELPEGANRVSQVYDGDLKAAVILFQERHRLTADGLIGPATLEAMNVSAATRLAQVRVNLERARWVVGGLRDTFVLVNLPAYKVYLIRGGKNVWESRTQIGREARQTPSFRGDMRYLVFNPDWSVPPTILSEDVLAGMKKGENVIERKGLLILDRLGREVDPKSIDWKTATAQTFPYTLRQPPGPDNALGRVKFMFPNEHSIFLHDTPSQELFNPDQRAFSSGCIRVEHPLELARELLQAQGWTAERVQGAVDAGKQQAVTLKESLPVLIVYWTVSVGASGELRFARDAYNLDGAVLRALDVAPQTTS